MIEHTYQVLGYHRLLEILSQYASCSLGQCSCLSLKPSNNAKSIDNELRLVSEMRLLLKVKGFLSFSDLIEITPILIKSSANGSCLEAGEFLCILKLIEACWQAINLLKSYKSLCPKMYGLARDMPVYDTFLNKLKETISLNGDVKDSASPTLKKIREKKIRLRSDLQKKLEGIQRSGDLASDREDNLVTIRDGRYVIALRTDHKSRIEGFVHDYSKTRATCFLEPVGIIQDNNRMAELAGEEKAEEFRILAGLTEIVRGLGADLESSQYLLGRLDGLYARARFSEALSCVMPEMDGKYGIELKGARNPILLALSLDSGSQGKEAEPPVPVDIIMDANQNILIISGPNRGGKTVTLKTLGLISLMAQAGIHIPVEEGSSLPIFDKVMANIGDDQDIQTGLSTFSAHAEHLIYTIEHSGTNSLVIIDEPGMGTDPDEGVALAMAILDFFSEQGTFVAVSTHLNRLKTYGLLNQRAINASVEFDTKKNCPTFKLGYGSCGISHALETAGDMGLPLSILDRARGYLDQDEVKLNWIIEKLNRLLVEAELEKIHAEEAKEKYNSAEKKIKDRLALLEIEKRDMLEAKRLEAEAVISAAREKLKHEINLLKMKKKSAQALVTKKFTEVSRRLMEHLELGRIEEYTSRPNGITKGLQVYHKKLKKRGVVQSVDHTGRRAVVMLGNVKVNAGFKDLELQRKEKGSIGNGVESSVSWELEGAAPRELNIIGYRVDDAIPMIDRTIDRALVDGELTLRIIHGFGTGRLREAVREHLKAVSFVKKICSADQRNGGDAITVVELS